MRHLFMVGNANGGKDILNGKLFSILISPDTAQLAFVSESGDVLDKSTPVSTIDVRDLKVEITTISGAQYQVILIHNFWNGHIGYTSYLDELVNKVRNTVVSVNNSAQNNGGT